MRSKLKLNVEHLTVDSFETAASQAGRGTVFGKGVTTIPTALRDETCWESCNGGCDTGPQVSYCASCDQTCDGWTCNNGPWSDCTCGYICGRTANWTNCNEVCI
jgi:hypothetical protein